MPISFAVLLYFDDYKYASAHDVLFALDGEYHNRSGFNEKHIETILMTANANGILREADYSLSPEGELVTAYCITPEGKKVLKNIKKN